MTRRAPHLLTMAEVAGRLGKSLRWLQQFVSGRPFGRMAGRTRLFTEDDFRALVDAMPRPQEAPCRSPSSRRAKAAHRTGGFVAPISDDTWTDLQARLTRRSPGSSSPGSAATSNVVSLPRRAN